MRFLLDHDVPDDAAFPLEALGYEVIRLREIAPITTPDAGVLRLAHGRGCVLLTCNRDDFIEAASNAPHLGIVILIRRRSRMLERAALVRLLDSAAPEGILRNITFA